MTRIGRPRRSLILAPLVLCLGALTAAMGGCHLVFGVGDPRLEAQGGGGAGGGLDGGGGVGGSGGAGGEGGDPSPDPCVGVSCEDNNPCTDRTCNQFGDCEPEFLTGELPISEQMAGDCKVLTCEDGVIATNLALTDAPPSPPNVCYAFVCGADGLAATQLKDVGTPCGNAGGTCDAAGLCSTCTVDGDCGVNTECMTFTCEGLACVATPTPNGTMVTTQVAGDCQQLVCMGDALPVGVPFVDDILDDVNDCTEDTCSEDGGPSNAPIAEGTDCAQGFCDSGGHCVECVFDEHCVNDPQGAGCLETLQCGCKGPEHCMTNTNGGFCLSDEVCGCASDAHCKVPNPYCNTMTRRCQTTKPTMMVPAQPDD